MRFLSPHFHPIPASSSSSSLHSSSFLFFFLYAPPPPLPLLQGYAEKANSSRKNKLVVAEKKNKAREKKNLGEKKTSDGLYPRPKASSGEGIDE